jgi:hypothetical protein
MMIGLEGTMIDLGEQPTRKDKGKYKAKEIVESDNEFEKESDEEPDKEEDLSEIQ